jgi:hypothetical protein
MKMLKMAPMRFPSRRSIAVSLRAHAGFLRIIVHVRSVPRWLDARRPAGVAALNGLRRGVVVLAELACARRRGLLQERWLQGGALGCERVRGRALRVF